MLPQLPESELEVAIPRRTMINRPMMIVAYPMMSYMRIFPR